MNFVVEISTLGTETIVHFTPSNNYRTTNDIGIIQELNINEPDNTSYWVTAFGGIQDSLNDYVVELRFDEFLTHVDTSDELKAGQYSIYIEDRIVYINIPTYSWMYNSSKSVNRNVHYFLTAPLNPDNPSNNVINEKIVPVIADVPNFTVKLSDNYNGVILNQGFNINFANNDGKFDEDYEEKDGKEKEKWILFNTPITIKKSIKDISVYDDFKPIREGFIESTNTKFDTFEVNSGDILSTFDNPVCKVITSEDYPDAETGQIGKSIPVVFGTKLCKLVKINGGKNLYALPEGTKTIGGVYNKDGGGVGFSIDGNIIKTTSEADTAMINGFPDNKLGEVLRALLKKTRFGAGFFINLDEWNKYSNSSPAINIEFTKGSIKQAINEVLKNDMVYFIQQPNGKFTLRKYNGDYTTHTIEIWQLTKNPEKDFQDAYEDYLSSCIINYDNKSSCLYKADEYEAEEKYYKRVCKEFNTNLTNEASAKSFAALLSGRCSKIRQTIKLSLGIDVTNFQLLDKVKMNFMVNDRQFTKVKNFFIKEINYSQDMITIEEL